MNTKASPGQSPLTEQQTADAVAGRPILESPDMATAGKAISESPNVNSAGGMTAAKTNALLNKVADGVHGKPVDVETKATPNVNVSKATLVDKILPDAVEGKPIDVEKINAEKLDNQENNVIIIEEQPAMKPEKPKNQRGTKYSDQQIKNIVEEIKGDGFKNHPLRQAYEKEVSDLAKTGEELLNHGMDEEKVAKTLYQARRDLGVKYKGMTPQPLRDYIYEINQGRYGDPLGPKFEKMINEGKTYDQIIKSASHPNIDIDKLLGGFEKWLRGQ